MSPKILALLAELEKTAKTYWNITPEVGRFLNEFIRKNNYQTVFEIGTSNGYSGIWLAEGLQHTGGTLYTIESHKKERYYLAQENFSKSGLTNINQILGHAPEDIPSEPKMFDLAFFDATKNEHLSYFLVLKDRINPGGAIITDNIDSHRSELEEYISTIEKTPGWKSEEIKLGTGLLISSKTL